MPWKETSVLDQRLRFIAAYLEREHSMTPLCQHFGVSRATGYKWADRYRVDGGIDTQRWPHLRA